MHETLNRSTYAKTKMNKSDAIIIIRSLLSSTSSSCSVSDLNKEFKNETGMDIPLFGYNNISDFLLSIPQVVKLTGIYPIERVSLVANEKSAHIVSLVKRQRSRKQRKKISSYRHPPRKTGISARCAEVQESHKVMGKENLDDDKEPNEKDCSLMSFVRNVLWDEFCVRLLKKALIKANTLYTGLLGCVILIKTKSTNVSFTFKVVGIIRSQVCLKNWCTDKEGVSQIDLKLHASVGEYIEVCPSEILSPDKFFFHLRKFKKKLGCFMNDLQTFYATHEEIPKLNASLIRPKQICAVLREINSEAKWYRAEIHEIVGDSKVIVNFIDIGSSAEILKDDLKFLHKDFISLPRQACSGSLANIKPLNFASEWSSLAVKRFYDLAFKKDLVAGIVHMDPQTCCMSVALSMTKGQEIHINDTLVKEGYAEFEKNVLDRQFVDKSKEENAPSESKTNIDKRQLFNEKDYYSKKHPENHIPSGIHISAFYTSNIYNSNCRLKKMFSII